MMAEDASETLRSYAAILEAPRRVDAYYKDRGVVSAIVPASEICRAAARALRLQADSIEKETGQ